ncbi:MAG: hypothetical protein QGG40_16140, partial [Myxococcota bacterium]|nr:hypothetical protein [Myxococcota bacterium]
SGYQLDLDEDPETTDDQSVYEIRNEQYANVISASTYYPWNDRFSLGLFGRGLEYGFKSVSDSDFLPYLQEAEAGIFSEFSNASYYSRSANPTRGRTLTLDLTHAWTDVVYEAYGGMAIDDGMVLDNYEYNKMELRWVENLPVPTFGGIPFLKNAAKHSHTIQVDALFGMIDRNVDANDEFRAGGQHPYYWGSNSLRPNTQFAGYPAFSLSGETMAMVNLAYRLPLDTTHRVKVGPLFYYGLYAQVGGTAGNLWSFRPPEDSDDYYRSTYGDRIAYDPADVRREIPFVDEAYKNGNAMLYDAQAELRMEATMFNGGSFNSFLRFAYGFNEIRGYGDVNGDDIIDTNDSAIGDELSDETEQPGLRVYVGLGTGW